MTNYRVGNHQPQNVYRGDDYIGVMFHPADASLVVEALNGAEERQLRERGYLFGSEAHMADGLHYIYENCNWPDMQCVGHPDKEERR